MKALAMHVEEYAERGFVTVGPLCAEGELGAPLEALAALQARAAADSGVTADWYRDNVFQWRHLASEHAAFAALLRRPAIAEVARALVGTERVQLIFDYVSAKPPRGGPLVPWHQDAPYLPIDRPRFVSCWLALDDVGPDSGPLRFVPGSHREGEAPAVDFAAPPRDWGERAGEIVSAPVAAGSAVFFDGLLWHMSEPNRTGRDRRAYVMVLMDADTRFAPERASHPIDRLVTVAAGARFNVDRFPVL
jgi:ectoine hydroxylase-related dioxygenase (phytanoyl-CoA dioxygenase family)